MKKRWFDFLSRGSETGAPDTPVEDPEAKPSAARAARPTQPAGAPAAPPDARTSSAPTELDDTTRTSGPRALPQRPAHLRRAGLIAGRYADLGEVARGGVGAVRRVRDASLRRQVAMKILHRNHAAHPAAIAQFVAEAQITGQLDHPNIVPVHELVTEGEGAPYFTMKLVEGTTLASELASAGPVPGVSPRLDEFLGMFLKVCDAVAFAHSRGVIHRDLKPQNIMVGSFGQVYVMDWGLAKRMRPAADAADDDELLPASSTAPGAINAAAGSRSGTLSGPVGTLPYMPPEQAQGKDSNVDERADVFTLGGVLYHILTGRAPHTGSTPMEVLFNAGTCQVVPPEQLHPEANLPRLLCRMAMKALARDPGERYATVLELKRDVERFLRGEGRFPLRTYPAGALVVAEGDEGDAAYIIKSGRCRAFKGAEGERRVLRTMGPGDVFGETAIFSKKPRTASVEALDELVVIVVTRESIVDGLAQQPWLVSFVQALADRFRDVDERLSELESELARK